MKKTLFFFWIILLSVQSFSQTTPDILWSKTLGGSSVEVYGYTQDSRAAIALSSDEKSIYIASTTASHDGYVSDSIGYLDGWLVKLNLDGDTLWTDVIGGTYYDAITDVTATPDGGCVICGYSNSTDGDFKGSNYHYNPDLPGYDFTDGFIAKYSADGVQEWIKMYGGQPLFEQTSIGIDELYNIIVTKDGGYMAVGFTYSITDDLPVDLERYRGGWLLKVDSKGKIQNSDKFTGVNHNENNSNNLFDIIEVDKDLYYAIGEQGYSSENNGVLSFETYEWVIKTDGKKILAEIEIGVKNSDVYASCLVQGPDKTIFTASSIMTSGGDIEHSYGMFDIWLVQLDTDLSIIDQRTYGGSGGDSPARIVKDDLGHYLITGYTNSHDHDAFGGYGSSDFWAVNFDENLDTLQTYRMGGSDSDDLTDAVFSKDGKSLYVTGRTLSTDYDISGSFGNQDIWVAKINQNQTLSVNPVSSDMSSLSSLYPNPTRGLFYISGHKDENVTISDITGKEIFSQTIESDIQEINLSKNQKGIYFVKFSNNDVERIIIN